MTYQNRFTQMTSCLLKVFKAGEQKNVLAYCELFNELFQKSFQVRKQLLSKD